MDDLIKQTKLSRLKIDGVYVREQI